MKKSLAIIKKILSLNTEREATVNNSTFISNVCDNMVKIQPDFNHNGDARYCFTIISKNFVAEKFFIHPDTIKCFIEWFEDMESEEQEDEKN